MNVFSTTYSLLIVQLFSGQYKCFVMVQQFPCDCNWSCHHNGSLGYLCALHARTYDHKCRQTRSLSPPLSFTHTRVCANKPMPHMQTGKHARKAIRAHTSAATVIRRMGRCSQLPCSPHLRTNRKGGDQQQQHKNTTGSMALSPKIRMCTGLRVTRVTVTNSSSRHYCR